jgi:hypothetical protein
MRKDWAEGMRRSHLVSPRLIKMVEEDGTCTYSYNGRITDVMAGFGA